VVLVIGRHPVQAATGIRIEAIDRDELRDDDAAHADLPSLFTDVTSRMSAA
jgi:hypothetical protein